jgi:hypothetical protein
MVDGKRLGGQWDVIGPKVTSIKVGDRIRQRNYTEPQVRLESLGVPLHSRRTPSGNWRENNIAL